MTAPGYADVQPTPDAPLHASTGPVVPEEDLLEAAVADPDAPTDFAEALYGEDESDATDEDSDDSDDDVNDDDESEGTNSSTTVAGS